MVHGFPDNLIFLCFLLLFPAMLTAGPTITEDQKLISFFEDDWEWLLQENPLFASRIGDLRFNDRLGDFSMDAVRRRQQHDLEVLKKLESFDRNDLSESNRLNYDLYLENTRFNIEGHQFADYLMPITQLNGIHQWAPDLHNFIPLTNTKQYEDYISRLNKIPAATDQTIAMMQEGLMRKITPPRITLREVGNQIKAQVVSKVEESPFYEPFRNFPEMVPDSDHDRLRHAAAIAIQDQVIPAFQKLSDFWSLKYYPNTRETIGLSTMPNGKAWYAFNVKVSTTTNLTPAQIHEIGLGEVKRIRAEMNQVIRESGFQGNFEEFTKFLRTDPQFYYTKPEDLLMGYRDICKRIDAELPKLFGKLPRIPYGVREVPAYSAPSQTTAYYSEGSLRAGRPGWCR